MPTSRPRGRWALFAAAALLTACQPSTGPDLGPPLDIEAALADYAAVDGLLGSSDWEGFRALAGRTPYSGSPAGVEAVAALHTLGTSGSRAFALELADRLASVTPRAGGPAAAPIISPTHRGATFVYDPELDQYAVDPDRSGAPATGVRFVLYEVDPEGRPIVAEEVGYADLIDEGDGSAEDVVLHLIVVVEDRTVLDYRTTVDVGLTWGEITVLGFLQSERGVRLDFDIEARGTRSLQGGTLDVSFEIGVQARRFSISGTVSGVQQQGAGSGDVALMVRHGAHTLEVSVSMSGGELDGAIHLNGELFATVTGDPENPTILSGRGDPLTPREQILLHRVLDTVEDVFDLIEDLVDPVDEIVLAGIIL